MYVSLEKNVGSNNTKAPYLMPYKVYKVATVLSRLIFFFTERRQRVTAGKCRWYVIRQIILFLFISFILYYNHFKSDYRLRSTTDSLQQLF